MKIYGKSSKICREKRTKRKTGVVVYLEIDPIKSILYGPTSPASQEEWQLWHAPSLPFPLPPFLHQQLQFVVNENCNTHLSKRLLHYIINRGQPASLARKLVSRVDRLFWLFFDFARPTALLQDRGEEFVRSCSVEKLARWDLSSLHWRLLCFARGWYAAWHATILFKVFAF